MPKGSEDKTPRKITVDFSGVEIRKGGGGIKVPEGDYLLEVRGVKRRTKKDDATRKYLEWDCYVVKPSSLAGKGPIPQRTSLAAESLWALRTFLVDLLGEKNVPQDSVEIPLAEIVAKKLRFGATIGDAEPYNGKVKSEIKFTYPKADYDETAKPESDDDEDDDEDEEDEEEDEKPAKKSKKSPDKKASKKKAKDDDDEDDEDEIDVDDI